MSRRNYNARRYNGRRRNYNNNYRRRGPYSFTRRRVYKDRLTGGTNDVNPQFMHARITQSGTNATTSSTHNIPIMRKNLPNATQVVEILKVFWQMQPCVAGTNNRQIALTTRDFGTTLVTLDNPQLICMHRDMDVTAMSGVINLTDENGHGFLLGSDKYYLQLATAGMGSATTAYIKIEYRFKNVTQAEYIGIVQGQS